MTCKYKSRVWDNGWCNVACCYCTLTQESDCKHNKQTNADRIRAMSDEELAEDYCKTILKVMQYYGIKNTGILEDAVRARLEWLKQPAEEGDGNG